MFGYDVFGAPALGFSASNNSQELKVSDISGLFWQGKSSQAITGGGKKYGIKSIPDPDDASRSISLSYVWPDTQTWTGHYFQIDRSPHSILWTSPILGDMSSTPKRNLIMTQEFRQEIIDAWDLATVVPVSCNTTDTYLGLSSSCTGGGNRCTDNSSGLKGGDKVLVQSGLGISSSKRYSEVTIPAGIIICPGTTGSFTPCTSNQEKVLGAAWTYTTGTDGNKIKTNGLYTCITKEGCPDEYNIDYKEPSLGYYNTNSSCGTDCISGASKNLLGFGNSSCILKIDEWNDGVVEDQTGQKSMTLAVGKSGMSSFNKRYLVAYKNADSSLNYKAGSGGLESYATETEATTAYDLAVGRRQAVLNPPEIIDDNGVIACTDPLRQSKSDGACDANCLTGHDYNTSGLCEKSEESGSNWKLFGIVGGIGLLAVLAMK